MSESVEALDFNNINITVEVDQFVDQCPYCRGQGQVRYLGWYLNGDEASSDMLQQVCRCSLPACGRLWVAVYHGNNGVYKLKESLPASS